MSEPRRPPRATTLNLRVDELPVCAPEGTKERLTALQNARTAMVLSHGPPQSGTRCLVCLSILEINKLLEGLE